LSSDEINSFNGMSDCNTCSGGEVFSHPIGEYDKYCSLSMSALLAREEVPVAHKRIADNYMIIKKIYGLNALQTRISNCDRSKLAKYDFSPLEYSTLKQINEEIEFLKKWSVSMDANLRKEANEILNIRVKELKFLNANKYALVSNEIYNGYMALEKYLEIISKY